MATGIRSNGFTEYPENPANSVGKKELSVRYEKTIATGAGVNTLHILSGPHTLAAKINAIQGVTPAFTSANDNDIGFYKKLNDGSFEAIDADILLDGADLSSAGAYRDLLAGNSSLDRDDNIGKLLGLGYDQEPAGGVYVGLLMKVASTAASEVLRLETKIEEGTTV